MQKKTDQSHFQTDPGDEAKHEQECRQPEGMAALLVSEGGAVFRRETSCSW